MSLRNLGLIAVWSSILGCSTHEDSPETLESTSLPMYGNPAAFWCTISQGAGCLSTQSSPANINVCYQSAAPEFQPVWNEIIDAMNRGYQRYGRLNFIWKNDGVYNNPDSNCLGSDQGIRLTINMIAAGGHSTGKIWDSFDGHFEAWTTVPDCGIVGGLDPVQPWVTKSRS